MQVQRARKRCHRPLLARRNPQKWWILTRSGLDVIRVNTTATLDGSIRTVELGTLEAIELCRDIAKLNNHDAKELDAKFNSAIEAYRLTQSNDETIAQDARDDLEWLMRETSNAMYDLGYLAYWEDSIFRIETINDESEVN